MGKRFQSPSFLWWILIPICIIYLFLMVHWPYAIPFNYLGAFGQFTYYLISNYRFLLLLILWSTFLAHFYEVFVARRICRQLNIDQESTYLWMIQTFILGFFRIFSIEIFLLFFLLLTGYPSLSILKGYTRRSLW